MVEHVKNILRELKLPYRILRLCGGDLGFTAALTFDFEVFSTAQDGLRLALYRTLKPTKPID